jgi:hypothetical protein
MPIIKMKQDWRDYKAGAIVETLNERVCEELIAAEFAERFENQEKDEREEKISLGFKYASLKAVDSQLEYFSREAERLVAKKGMILEEIMVIEDKLLKGDAEEEIKIEEKDTEEKFPPFEEGVEKEEETKSEKKAKLNRQK